MQIRAEEIFRGQNLAVEFHHRECDEKRIRLPGVRENVQQSGHECLTVTELCHGEVAYRAKEKQVVRDN
jgi:hypothetical protein